MKSTVFLTVFLPKLGESSAEKCFRDITAELARWTGDEVENGAAVLYDPNFVLVYQRQNGSSGAPIKGAPLSGPSTNCRVYEEVQLVNGLAFRANTVGLNLGFALGKSTDFCEPTVIAVVKVVPGMESTFINLARTILVPTRDEPGSVVYRFHQSTTDKTVFTTYERWKSFADLDEHMKTGHMQEFFKQVGPILEPGFPVIHTVENIECTVN